MEIKDKLSTIYPHHTETEINKMIYSNIHKWSIRGKNESNDCVVRSVAVATGWNYDIAHELYHLLTWEVVDPGTEPGPESLDEKYANLFASVLLLPGESVTDEFQRRVHSGGLSFADIVAMAREFGVSVDALLWRLGYLKLVEKASVQQVLANDGLRQIDRVERRKDQVQKPPRPSARFVTLAFECLMNGTLSRGRFAETMGIRRGQVRTFLDEYVFDETVDYTGQVSAT